MNYTYCKLCGEEFESKWSFRVRMWKWSHLRRSHPYEFNKIVEQRWRIRKGE